MSGNERNSDLHVLDALTNEVMPPLDMLDAAMGSSASQDDSATLSCFFEAQETAAELYMKTQPVVECFSDQSESDMP